MMIGLALGLPAFTAPLIPDDYRSWEKTTQAPLDYPIPGHLDHYRIPYINPTGTGVEILTHAGRVTYAYPKGTVIVKESYQGLTAPKPGDRPVRIYAMIKDPENPKARGGWVWVLRELPTGKESIYQSPLCFDCHSAANEPFPYGDRNPNGDFRDYVFFPYRK
jgi:hypothetical protein